MKKYKVALTARARASITRIITQLRAEVSPRVAHKVRQGILETIRKLETLPESHQIFEEISDEQVVYRRILKWDYKIVFTVNNDMLEVVVVQVYHGSRDPNWITEQFKP